MLDFTNLLSLRGKKKTKQKTNDEMNLNDDINHLHLTDIYRAIYPIQDIQASLEFIKQSPGYLICLDFRQFFFKLRVEII